MRAQLSLNVRLKDSSSFDNFYPGRNREALERLRSICRATGANASDRVMFLWGPAGCGRTHLLQAACRAAQETGGRAFYLPLAAAAELTPQVLEDVEYAALVCLDDIEAVSGQDAWERALFALFERLRAAGGALAVAGAAAPRHLGLRLPDLATRLGWGPVYQLEPLDDEDKLAAVRLRAHQRGLDIAEEVARYILAHYPRDTESLFELLDRLDRKSLASQRRITIPFLKEIDRGAE
jgi:DnaA family protein